MNVGDAKDKWCWEVFGRKKIENSFEESSSNILQSRELVAYALSCATSDEIGVAEVLHVINVSALK